MKKLITLTVLALTLLVLTSTTPEKADPSNDIGIQVSQIANNHLSVQDFKTLKAGGVVVLTNLTKEELVILSQARKISMMKPAPCGSVVGYTCESWHTGPGAYLERECYKVYWSGTLFWIADNCTDTMPAA